MLLEAGHGASSATWRVVQKDVATFTRVCRYDRAGLGRSDPDSAGRARTGSDIVADLHALLVRVDSAGPYLLVGHSLGAPFIRLYAAEHPEAVAGLVLVDGTHEREGEAVDEMLTPEQRGAGAGTRPISPEGIDVDSVLAQLRASDYRPEQSVVVIARGRPLGADEMPPTWSAEQRLRREQIRKALQANLARMHPRGELVIASRSGHFVQHDQPELVTTAVRQLVTGWRDSSAAR